MKIVVFSVGLLIFCSAFGLILNPANLWWHIIGAALVGVFVMVIAAVLVP